MPPQSVFATAATRLSAAVSFLVLALFSHLPAARAADEAVTAYVPAQTRAEPRPPATIRFLLTFDDGPSGSDIENPTESILDDLAQNPIQPGIKAIFFVQTRAAGGGGTELGRKIMQREVGEGHLLGFHTATRGHSNHRGLDPERLEQSLADGVSDLATITGAAPKLVRPPFWDYDQKTFASYRQHGLQLLMTDLNANDGKTWGFIASPRRRTHLMQQLTKVREQIESGEMKQTFRGDLPVIVSFHDINRYTAHHMQEYLQILMDCARELGLHTAAKPFYDSRPDIEAAAISRTINDATEIVRMPGFWARLWQ